MIKNLQVKFDPLRKPVWLAFGLVLVAVHQGWGLSARWIEGNNHPDLFERTFHSSEVSPKGYNRGRYVDPEVDQLLDYARQEANREKRRIAYSRIQKILSEDLRYISLGIWTPFAYTAVAFYKLSGLLLEIFDFLQTLKIKNEPMTQDISENGKDIWSLCCAM